MTDQFYTVEIAGVKRDLPLLEIAPGLKIAVLNILGDTELVRAASQQLALKLADSGAEVLVSAEAKAIPLAHMLSSVMDLPYVILRKTLKSYMGKVIEAETLSITTGTPQKLYLDEKDQALIVGRQVAIIDDVISTGSTLQAMRSIVERAGGKIVAQGAIFTEGDQAKWTDVIALGHLPVFMR
jgi:adenine/guanine phosphoribosyltransferase-like PRPP-binding protein